ncbi:hypothetical protein E4T66_18550 [Sinimarinibacterium sp. CAU 1509]|uniref:hypothetical protein n=1 Tax=Sinimarinibacterium sp. CAU 1509 TaxID=2562283 RepID=UPI0010AC0236|nr:hypothetical protein [Sinimarinibacterium sp. CAU 1509]TJY57408.1 hypothetical protein E4T66_18550 [Sinimarinibacterium sp. CAU 1509]
MAYALPTKDTYAEWHGCSHPDYRPNARQWLVIDAVALAQQTGLHYTDDVVACAAKALNFDLALQTRDSHVEHGAFGMEVYYACNYLNAQRNHRRLVENHEELKPQVGDQLGSLVFNNDFKRNTGCVITAIDALKITLRLHRGKLAFETTTDATGIRYAIDRAYEKRLRQEGWQDFIGARRALTAKATKLGCKVIPSTPVPPPGATEKQRDLFCG